MAQLVIVNFNTNGGTFVGEKDYLRAVPVGGVYGQTCNVLDDNPLAGVTDAPQAKRYHFENGEDETCLAVLVEAADDDADNRISVAGSSNDITWYTRGTGPLVRRAVLISTEPLVHLSDVSLTYVYDLTQTEGTINKLEIAYTGGHAWLDYSVPFASDFERLSAGYSLETTQERLAGDQKLFFRLHAGTVTTARSPEWNDFLEVAPTESFRGHVRRALFLGTEIDPTNYQTCAGGSGIPLLLPVPVRDGYRFAGWKDTAGNLISDTSIVKLTSNHTLTASWVIDSFSDDLRSMKRTNIADTAQILKTELAGKCFMRGSKEVHIGGYPIHNLPRTVNGQRQVVTDSKWSESVGMIKPLGNPTYPRIQGYNVEAMPRVLIGFADYLVARNWRYRVLIDGALSTLIRKFVITTAAETDVVINNNAAYLYEQTEDTYFQASKTYYKRTKTGYYSVPVTAGDPVRTQTGYVLTTDTVYVAGKKYYRRTYDPSLFAKYRYTLITGWTAGDPIPNPESVCNPEYLGFNDYYERQEMSYPDYVLRLQEENSTTPDTNRYYEPVTSGAMTAADVQYYAYLSGSNDYIKCHLLKPLPGGEHYYVQYYDTSVSAYNYRTIEEEFPATSGVHVIGDPQLNGRAIYRREATGGGYAYTCIGIVNDCDTVFVGLTKNTTFTAANWRQSKLYTQVTIGSSTRSRVIGTETKALYVDPEDEDIEAIKDATNVFLQRYRTILLVSGRKVPKYSIIKGDEQYTTPDLIMRINAIVTSMCEYSTTKINPLPEDNYTVRDMKLKINEILDYIVNESYYFRICTDPSFEYSLRNLTTDFQTFVSEMLYTMANDSVIPENTRSYNDRWYFYDPSLEYAHDVYQKLNYTATSSVKKVGNIQRQALTDPTWGGYTVCINESGSGTWIPLCQVANVYNMADTWSRCNYEGCMQVLDLTLNLLNSRTPGGDGVSQSWKVAMTNPVKTSATAAEKADLLNVLNQLNAMQTKLEAILAKAPAHADVMVDIAYHVLNLPKVVRDSIYPVRQPVTSYQTDTAYYRLDGSTYIALPIHSSADFVTYKALYGTIYAWVFLRDRS